MHQLIIDSHLNRCPMTSSCLCLIFNTVITMYSLAVLTIKACLPTSAMNIETNKTKTEQIKLGHDPVICGAGR